MATKLLRITATLAVLAIAWFTLQGQLPDFDEVLEALQHADTRWLLVAGLAMFGSIGLFARQQRRLLTGFGVTLPRHRAIALAYSRSAMSISLPAGSAVSAAYAFQQFRASGVDRRAAATAMVLSGALSIAGLVVLYASGTLASAALGLGAAWQSDPLLAVGAVVLLAVTFWLLTRFASRSVAPRHWLLALAAAAGSWTTDLLCLVATAEAFDLPLGVAELGAIWVAVQLVRQIPLTPGNIGVIEAGLLAGMATAGATGASAAAAVLTYRVLSCWLVIPLGLFGWLVLRSRSSRPVSPARSDHRTPPEPPHESSPDPSTAQYV